MRRLASVLFVFSLFALFHVGCRGPAPEEKGVSFVHATDPHLFHESKKNWDDRIRLRQEELNQKSFEDLIRTLGSIPGTKVEPSFLVMTGDFGLDRFSAELQAQPVETQQPPSPVVSPLAENPQANETASDSEELETATGSATSSGSQRGPSFNAASAVEYLISTLGKSPVKEIYLVPGNNDVDGESPAGPPVLAMQRFWSRVQRGLAGTGVTLHDLTACYFEGGQPSSCFADIDGTSYRLIGFPSHSFKDGVSESRPQVQMEQLQTLTSLVDQAARQGKQALILTHIPELDDPKAIADREFGLLQRKLAPDSPAWAETSAWDVRAVAFEKWKKAVESSAVVGVLAGHFHDSHKEVYRKPYDWSTPAADRADLRKLYLAPPLSVRYQDQSPIQARGFSLFQLAEQNPPRRTLYWYSRNRGTFEPEPMRVQPSSFTWPAAARWYWTVTGEAADLARAAVIAIAFLAAFLTILQLWEVPPAKTPLAGPAAQDSNPQAANGTNSSGALQGNFAKTVIAGLGGMLALSFLKAIWDTPILDAEAYYILLFVTFFFGFLILYAILQSLIEALRSRLVTQYTVRPWRHREPARREGESSTRRSIRLFRHWLTYWQSRTWHWLLSLRILLLILFDTFFNVLRGRNQLQTVVFAKTIINLHRSIIRAADRIREEVEAVLLEALKEVGPVSDEDVRVSVSVLSQNEETLFYVAREKGSLARGFDKRSVAWVSVYTGQARWWKKSYDAEVELFKNSGTSFPLLEGGVILLDEYYQRRPGSDYAAFIVLPVPWSHRDASDGVRKAGIQISFRDESHLAALFESIDDASGNPAYDGWEGLLRKDTREAPRVEDNQLRNVLLHSLEVLEELFADFNETVFELYIRPEIRPQ